MNTYHTWVHNGVRKFAIMEAGRLRVYMITPAIGKNAAGSVNPNAHAHF